MVNGDYFGHLEYIGLYIIYWTSYIEGILTMTLQDFISKYDRKTIDFDGSYGNQCQDLYRQYVKEVLNFPQSPAVPGAKDNWDKYLPDYYDRITNTPEGVPEPGDIIIWGAEYGQWGHVAICIKSTTSTLTCFSQNDPTGSPCVQKLYRSYRGVLGWFHPKQKTSPELEACLADRLKFWQERDQAEASLKVLTEFKQRIAEKLGVSADIEVIEGQISTLVSVESKFNDLSRKYDSLQAEHVAELKVKEDQINTMAVKIEDISKDYQDQLERIKMNFEREIDSLKKANDHLQDQLDALKRTQTTVKKSKTLIEKLLSLWR